MRLFLAALAVMVFVAFGLRAEASRPAGAWDYETLSTLDLISLQDGADRGVMDPTGVAVELLLVPTRVAHIGGRKFLQDEITGLTCAPSESALSRAGEPGDDFLVVRGVMSQPDAAGVREIVGCQVVNWDGVVWEESRAIEAEKQEALFAAGRL